MARIFTRQWFWLLVTTLVPVLWQVLAAKPSDDAASAAASAKELKAAHEICVRLAMKAC